MERYYVKKLRLKKNIKEGIKTVLFTSLILIILIGLYKTLEKIDEGFIENCVNAGNSRYYCEKSR